jgi:hypothetical protein
MPLKPPFKGHLSEADFVIMPLKPFVGALSEADFDKCRSNQFGTPFRG